jgi:hypothetical protein
MEVLCIIDFVQGKALGLTYNNFYKVIEKTENASGVFYKIKDNYGFELYHSEKFFKTKQQIAQERLKDL